MIKKLALVGAVVAGVMMVGACGAKEGVAESKPLASYEVYGTYSEKYQELGDNLVEQYMSEGKTEEEACKTAITDVQDQLFMDEAEFAEKYMCDMDWNGISDAVERGEITQEEIDEHYKNFRAVSAN